MIKALLLASFSWLTISQCYAGDPCPDKKKIFPCTCTQDVLAESTTQLPTTVQTTTVDMLQRNEVNARDNATITTIVCESPETLSQLEDKVSVAVDRKWIDRLVVFNIPPEKRNSLARLPTNWLRNGRIRQLEIQNTQLSGDFIWNKILSDQEESLYWLKVSNCNLFGALTYDTAGTVQTRGLNSLRKLQVIDFSSNHLSAILENAFKVPPNNLTTVILAKNNIQDVYYTSFSQIPYLKYIDMSHNLLTYVARSFFDKPARFLEHIDLSWNSLKYLPENFFENMPALEWVDVSYNFLHSLPIRPWSLAWKQLTHINTSGNFLECDCQLLWLLPYLRHPSNNEIEYDDAPQQTIMGQCSQVLPWSKNWTQPFPTINHKLISLKRDSLVCWKA